MFRSRQDADPSFPVPVVDLETCSPDAPPTLKLAIPPVHRRFGPKPSLEDESPSVSRWRRNGRLAKNQRDKSRLGDLGELVRPRIVSAFTNFELGSP